MSLMTCCKGMVFFSAIMFQSLTRGAADGMCTDATCMASSTADSSLMQVNIREKKPEATTSKAADAGSSASTTTAAATSAVAPSTTTKALNPDPNNGAATVPSPLTEHKIGPLTVNGITIVLIACTVLCLALFGMLASSSMTTGEQGATKGLSTWDTTSIIFAIYVGAALLQMPYAFSLCGWVAAAVIALVTLSMCFTGGMLVESLDAVVAAANSKPDVEQKSGSTDVDLASVGRLAFGNFGEQVVGAVLVMEVGLIAIYFLVLASTNIQVLCASVNVNVLLLGTSAIGSLLYGVSLVTPWALAAFNNSFGMISLIACAVALTIGGLALPVHAGPEVRAIYPPGMNDLLKAFGLIAVSYGGHPVLPTAYNQCGVKKNFYKCFLAGIGFAGVFYAAVGAIGFHYYGTSIGSVFTTNLGMGMDGKPLNGMGWLRAPVSIGIAVKLMAVYPFLIETIAKVGDRSVSGMQVRGRIIVIVVITLLALCFSKNIVELADLAGCLLVMATNVFIPVSCHMKIFARRYTLWDWSVSAFVLACGVVLAIYGSAVALRDVLNPPVPTSAGLAAELLGSLGARVYTQ